MRTLGMVVTVAALGVSGVAEAQMRRPKGNQDQQTPGYEQVRKKEEKRFPLGSSWIAVSMNGKAFSGSERPTFSVDDQFRVRGFGGCNSFSATAFPLREQGIAVGPLAITKRACDKGALDAEVAYLMALRHSAKWDTQIGSLVIRGPNGELKFERSL